MNDVGRNWALYLYNASSRFGKAWHTTGSSDQWQEIPIIVSVVKLTSGAGDVTGPTLFA